MGLMKRKESKSNEHGKEAAHHSRRSTTDLMHLNADVQAPDATRCMARRASSVLALARVPLVAVYRAVPQPRRSRLSSDPGVCGVCVLCV